MKPRLKLLIIGVFISVETLISAPSPAKISTIRAGAEGVGRVEQDTAEGIASDDIDADDKDDDSSDDITRSKTKCMLASISHRVGCPDCGMPTVFKGLCEIKNTIESGDTDLSSQLDDCCVTMGAQLDTIESLVEMVSSQVENIEFNLTGTFIVNPAVESKLDIFMSDFDACCASMTDKLDGISNDLSTIESKIDSCCFTSNSKLDILLANDDDLLSQLEACCFTIGSRLDTVDTGLGDIESKIDACCFTSNSKLDILLANDDDLLSQLDACCFTIGSRLDTVDTGLGDIESKIDSCCFTSNSKLDILLGSDSDLSSQLDACCVTIGGRLDSVDIDLGDIESKIDACCFTSNSKLDILLANDDDLLSQLDACCFTIGSRLDTVDTGLGDIESKIDACCFTSNSKLDILLGADSNLESQIDACCFTTQSKLDILLLSVGAEGCGGIPILTLDPVAPANLVGTVYITESGSYCLSQALQGTSPALVIEASEVVVDLGGYTIRGNIILGNGREEITLKNGIIEGSITGTLCDDLFLEHISLQHSGAVGLDIFTSITGLYISDCIVDHYDNIGIRVRDGSTIQLHNVTFIGQTSELVPTATGLVVFGAEGLELQDCLFRHNSCGVYASGLTGSRIDDGQFSECRDVGIYLNNCNASQCFHNEISKVSNSTVGAGTGPLGPPVDGGSGAGIVVSGGKGINLREDFIAGYLVGVNVIGTTTAIYINQEVARDCGTGFYVAAGVNGFVRDCSSLCNWTGGYDTSTPAGDIKFAASVGQGSGTNPDGGLNDTNYRLNGLTGAAANNFYKQISIGGTGLGYWNNVTAQ